MGGRSDDELALDLGSLVDARCELCGYPFQFSPEYSTDYQRSAGIGFAVRIAGDISKSLLQQAWRNAIPFIRIVLWLIIFPFCMGVSGLFILSLLAGSFGETYHYRIIDLNNSWFRVYFTGSAMSILGSVILDRLRTRLGLRRDRRQRSIRTLAGTAAVGLPSGILGILVPYVTGRICMYSLTRFCQGTKWEICESVIANEVSPLVDFNHDVSSVSIGMTVLIALVVLGSLLWRVYSLGIPSLLRSLISRSSSLTHRATSFIVPLLIGRVLLSKSPDFLITFVHNQSRTAQLFLTILLGCVFTVPSVLMQRWVFDRIFAHVPISYTCRVALYGRIPSDTRLSYTVTVIRAFAQVSILLISVIPALKFLEFVRIFPLKHEPVDFPASPLVLPFELFYAHVIIPLMLNSPPIPPRITHLWERLLEQLRSRVLMVGLKEVAVGLALTGLIFFVSIVSLVSLPLVTGRLIIGPSEDLMSFSIGFLVLLVGLHVVARLMTGRRRSSSSVSEHQAPLENVPQPVPTRLMEIRSWLKTFLSVFITGLCASVVFPMMIGTCFHLGMILPLRRFSAHKPSFSWSDWSVHDLLPQWIIGVMLLKIAIAMGSIGAVRRFKLLIEHIKRDIEERGLTDTSLHLFLFREIFFPVLRICLLFCFIPFLIGRVFEPIGDLSVLLCWVIYLGIFQAVPRLAALIRRQKELALVRRNLLRTKLRNLD